MVTLEAAIIACPYMFDNIVLPEGRDTADKVNHLAAYPPPDKHVLLATIERVGGHHVCVYTNPDVMRMYVYAFFKSHAPMFDKLWRTLWYEYSPLENYDRNEDYKNGYKKQGTDERTGNSNETSNNTTLHDVSAFNTIDQLNNNQSPYSPDTRDTSDSGRNTNTTDTGENEESGDGWNTGRVHGNIGVTTSQQMLQSERDLAVFDWYETVATIFDRTFTIGIV